MTVCYPEFILPKFLAVYIPMLIVHLVLLLLLRRQKVFRNRRQLLIVNAVFFIFYTAIIFVLGHGINEFGVTTCIGD